MPMLEIESTPGPLFVTVTGRAPLVVFRFCVPNDKLVGESVTVGTAPLPDRLADCGLEAPLSVMNKDADRAPDAAGVKVRFTVQELYTTRAAGLMGQLFVCAKSPAFAPVMPMLEMASRPGPLLVTVTVMTPLVVPRF